MNDKERKLLKMAGDGCVEAFEELIKPYKKRVYNLILYSCCSEFEASQLAQEVFIRVFDSVMKKDYDSFPCKIYKTTDEISRQAISNSSMIS